MGHERNEFLEFISLIGQYLEGMNYNCDKTDLDRYNPVPDDRYVEIRLRGFRSYLKKINRTQSGNISQKNERIRQYTSVRPFVRCCINRCYVNLIFLRIDQISKFTFVETVQNT